MPSEGRSIAPEEELRIVYELDRVCDETLDLDLLLGKLLRKVRDLLGAERAAFILLDEETGRLRLAHYDGEGDGEAFFERKRAWIEKAFQEEGREGAHVGEGGDRFCRISMGDVPVGVLAVSRGPAFTEREAAMFAAIEGQIDNGIEHAKTHGRLQARVRELETLYRIDRIRDATEDLQEMLRLILAELQSALDAEMGFIMLYSEQLQKLELKAIDEKGGSVLLRAEEDIINRVSDLAVGGAKPIIWQPEKGARAPVRQALAAPLFLRENLIGVFGVLDKRNGRSFDRDDCRLLHAIISQADTAIFEDARKALLMRLFKKFVSPQVAEEILRDPYHPYLEGEKKEITALFADLRGYSPAVADMDPKDVVSFLNEFLGEMSKIVLANDGTLDKFIGDEVVALFGAPIPFDDHAVRAARAAIQMQEKLRDLNESWARRGLPCFGMGIGLNSGEMVVGNIGGEMYLDYTAIGANMNLASRLQGIAKGGQILLAPGACARLRDLADLDPLGEVSVKGFATPLPVHCLRGLRRG